MNANYFDRLEAELQAAVPRLIHGRRGSWSRWSRWRPRLSGVALVSGVAMTVAVVLVFAGVGARHHGPVRPTRVHPHGGADGELLWPSYAVPTLGQLLDNFAVLRRPQTVQDRSWHPGGGNGPASRQLNRLTRLATVLPGGYRVFLDVEQFIWGGQLNTAAGSYVLNFTIVDPRGNGSGSSFGPNTNYGVEPIPSGGRPAIRHGRHRGALVWASVVPDGVASVTWTFGCSPAERAPAACAGGHSLTVTVPVVDNVAARRLTWSANCGFCARQVMWRSADGAVVASFGGFGNLAAPPFVKGGHGNGALRAMLPSGIGSARFGQSWSSAIQTLTQLLGPPADPNLRVGGCGIDHESVWTSPAVAEPLTIYARAGRFVGYLYGAPVNEIGVRRGPGLVLYTPRGLTLGDSVAVGKRLYRPGFTTRAAGGGTWRATSGGGVLRGSVVPITYPLRVVTGKNLIATIAAGKTACAASGN